jgi:hypothetical protein
MTKQQSDELKSLKSEINQQKSRLLEIARKVSSISPRQGDQLGVIIGSLEHWQHK